MLPSMFTEKKLATYLTETNKVISNGKSFINITSPLLEEVKQFIQFINDSFTITYSYEEFEIDEVINIFSYEQSLDVNFLTNDIAIKAIRFYIKNINVYDDKIYSVSCKYWDKKKEVKEFITDYIGKSREIKSSYNAYQLYTSGKNKFKVNKLYFESIYDDISSNN